MATAKQGFPKQVRLRGRGDYLSLSARGKKVHTANFIVVWAESPCQQSRFGITASRKVGGAVVRNRMKRLLREYLRMHLEEFPAADYNIIVRQGAVSLDFSGLCRELDRFLSRLNA